MNHRLAAKRVAAAVFAMHLAGYSIQAAADSLPPGCDDLVKTTQQTTSDRIQSYVPLVDPASALSEVSCIDRILSTRINFASWFSIDGILNQLFDSILQRACHAADTSWNNLLNRIRTATTVNVTLPYNAVGLTTGVGPKALRTTQASLVLPGGHTTSTGGSSDSGLLNGIRGFWNRLLGG
jgi:hypothetical protein